MKAAIKNELLRQAKLTFNIAVSVSAISAMITLSGVGLVYVNKLSEAALTGSAGALATMTCLNMAKESKDELLKILEQEEEDDEN